MCCALPSCVQGLAEPGPPQLRKGESKWCCSWVMVLLLSIWVCLLLGRFWFDNRRTVVDVHPAQWCTPFEGFSLGWGLALATVAAEPFPKTLLHAFVLGPLFGIKLCSSGGNVGSLVCMLLDFLVAQREPTPGNDDPYSVGILEKYGQTLCQLPHGTVFISGCWLFGCSILGTLGILDLAGQKRRLVICRWSLPMFGGWLTFGDMTKDSSAQFLAVTEHRSIPVRARYASNQLRKAVYQSVCAPACQDQVAGGHASVGVVSLVCLLLPPLSSRSSLGWAGL